MAEDVNASIGIDIDTSKAIAAIRQLSAEISAFHQLHSKKGAAVAKDLAAQTQNLTHLVNRTGAYRASMTSVASATQSFTTALEKNKLTMGETMRYAMGSMKPFSRMFKSEWEMVSKVARERVKDLQTQYIRLGRDANGALQAVKIRPLTLDMDNLQTKTMLAAQRMQILNKLVEHGSTQLLNWGKNTQWAGRQLMVGFTIPLTMLGAASAKTFMDMEKQIIKIQRVYGDFSTTIEDTKKMTDALKDLSLEFTKWGVSVNDTLSLAADAAATGAMGADLINQVTNATKLAVLGNVKQAEALETTMSVTNAFGIATQDLAKKIDFLNAVENQSVTSIQDLTTAIPIAAPVVKQLGGSVEDLAFFMTAMKEGGIDAGEGANALKSGLASIINPTEKASEMLMQFGINVKGIVEANKGDVKSIVIEFAQALDKLDPLNRAQAIEQLFGKFQFSRISTLFQNVIKEGTQAQRVLELSRSSTEQLAILSKRELAKVEESTTYKFEAAMKKFQASLAPVGEEFLKAVTPLLDFGTQLLEQFNKWDDGAKAFAVTFAAVLGGIGPVLLMSIGLVANGVANLIKLFQLIAKTMFGVGNNTKILGMQTEYMTQDMITAQAAATSLGQAHSSLTQIYTSEAAALQSLATALERAAASQRKMQGAAPVVGRTKKMAVGGIIKGSGTGTSDSIPAMLSNGEAVIPAAQVKANRNLVQALISGNVPGYAKGGMVNKSMPKYAFGGIAGMIGRSRVATRMPLQYLLEMILSKDKRYKSGIKRGVGIDAQLSPGVDRNSMNQRALSRVRLDAESRAFGIPETAGTRGRPTYGSVATFGIIPKLLNILFGRKASGKQFNALTNPMSNQLDPYGEISLIGKRSLSKRSTAFANDSIMFASRVPEIYGRYAKPLPMIGTSENDFNKLGKFPYRPKETEPRPNYYKYYETQTLGGFNLKEIAKIISKNPEATPLIRAALKQAGVKIPVRNQRTGLMAKIFGYATGGIIKGPGTGKSDSIPAMVSNGEAIIPADMAKKYSPLVNALISGNVPGYKKGKNPVETTIQYPQSARLEASHMAPASDILTEKNIKQIKAKLTAELKDLIKKGVITREMADFDRIENLQVGQRVQSGMTPLLPADINQGYANPKFKGYTPTEILEKLNKSGAPTGAMLGSGVQALDVFRKQSKLKNAGVSDKNMKKYFDSLGQIFEKEMQTLAKENKPLTEKELQEAFLRANEKAISTLPPAAQAALRQATALGTAQTQVVQPSTGKGTSEGRSPKGSTVRGFTPQDQSRANRRNVERVAGRFPFVDVNSRKFKGKAEQVSAVRDLQINRKLKQLQARNSNRASELMVLIDNAVADAMKTGSIIKLQQASAELDKELGIVKDTTQKEAKKAVDKEAKQGEPKSRRRSISQSELKDAMTPAEKRAVTIARNRGDEAEAKRLENAKKKQIRAAEEAAKSAEAQAKFERDSARAKKAAETRRRKAEEAAAAAEAQTPQRRGGRFRGVGSLAMGGAMLAGPAMQAASGEMPDLLGTAFGIGAVVDAVRVIKDDRAEKARLAAEAAAKTGQPIAQKAGTGLAGMTAKMSEIFGRVGLNFTKLIPVIGWLITGITILTTIYQLHTDAIDKARQKGFAFAETLASTNKKLISLAEVAGTVTASEEARAKEAQRLAGMQGTEISGFGRAFFETDAGKAMAEQVKASLKQGLGKPEIAKAVGLQLAEAVAQGAITAAEATSVGAALAQQLGDTSLIIGIKASMDQIIGPNGEDLAKEPLKVTLALTEETSKQFAMIDEQIAKTATTYASGISVYARANVPGAGATTGIYANETIASGQAMMGIEAVSQGQRMLDVLNKQYDSMVNQVKQQIEITDQADSRLALEEQIALIENQRTDALDKQIKANNDVRQQVEQTILSANFSEQTRDEALRTMVKTLYEGDEVMQTLAKGAMEMAQAMKDVQTMDVQIQLASGFLDPASATTLLKMIGNNEQVSTNYSLIIDQQGDAAAAELMKSLLSGGANEATVSATLDIVVKGGDIQQITESVQQLGKLEALTGDQELVSSKQITKLNQVKSIVGDINEQKVEKVLNFEIPAGSWEALAQIEGFNELPEDQKRNFTAEFAVLLSMQGELSDDYARWGGPAKGTFADYAASIVGSGISSGNIGGGPARVSATTTETVDGGGGGGRGKTAEEQLLEDLNFALSKQQKALDLIAMQEDVINEKYDKRKEALDEIAAINAQIAEEQRAQLDVADALASGDIAAAARAAQAMRAQAAEKALKDQEKSLEDARKAELARVSFDGLTRDQLEGTIKDLERQIAELEYRMPKPEDTGGGGGGGGGTRTVDVPMPDWVPDGYQPGGTWTIQNGMWVYTPPAVVPAPTAPGTITEKPVAPQYADALTTRAYDEAMLDFVEATNQWKAQTYTVIDSLGLTGNEFSKLGTNTDLLKAQIMAMGGEVTSEGIVKLKGMTTDLNSLSQALNKDIVPNMKTATEEAYKIAVESGVTGRALEETALSAADTAAATAIAAGRAGTQAQKALAAARVATGDMTIRAYEAAFGARAMGGLVTGPGTGTSDSIPTMLSNGEYVIRASSVAKIGTPLLDAINEGRLSDIRGGTVSVKDISVNSRNASIKNGSAYSDSGSVYNYSVVVNAETNANPDQIASAVMSKIKQVEEQRIRGVIR